jgi:hypothetical protein
MLVTGAGTLNVVKFVAFWNAFSPILVSFDPTTNDTVFKLVTLLKALSPILVTVVPTDTDWMLLIGTLLGTLRIPDISLPINVPFVRLNSVCPSTDIVTPFAPLKDLLGPMLTLKVVRLLELSKNKFLSPDMSNAGPWSLLLSILVTELGMVIDFKFVVILNAPAPILVTELGMFIDTKFSA